MAEELTTIEFVHEDGERILNECQQEFETLLGRQIAPADVEMLLINGLAYRELLIRTGINEAARQNLVSFAKGPALEYLGLLVGVTRLPAATALCSVEFSLVAGHNGVVIPEGLRVQSTDGKIIFQTIESRVCPVGTLTAQLRVAATTTGVSGNGYAANKINIILDPKAFLSTAQNIDETKGGSDEETDDELRERIMLAPATFSVAGPKDAYKYFAKSAHAAIVDVAVTSPTPGQVYISPLLENGEMPSQEILEAVQAICNADKIRPLTDTVITAPPALLDYEINVELTLLTTAVNNAMLQQVQKVLEAYKESRKNRLGLDVVKNKIASLCMVEGIYNVNVVQPANNIVATPETYTRCTGITINIIGVHDE